jgi:nitrite reductase/ring-hydroxylating ferredoxin subunit
LEFIDIGSIDEIPHGRPTTRVVGGRTIALCTCPHRGGPLGEGDLIGEELVCPWHLWSFDVKSGNCPGSTEVGVAAHDVKIEGGRVFVRLAPPRRLPELL